MALPTTGPTLTVEASAPSWMQRFVLDLNNLLARIYSRSDGPFRLRSYAKADLPDPVRYRDSLIKVSDETGGDTVAFSDGTNWRRVQDRAIVS